MKLVRQLFVAAALLVPTAVVSFSNTSNDASSSPQDEELDPNELIEMLEQYSKYTNPGPEHEFLELLLGEWDVTARMTMMGAEAPGEKGRAVTTWKVPGRFIESTWTGKLMSMDGTAIVTMGYDRMRQSYVYSRISSMDTALYTAEGDLTRDQGALVMWGTLDEWMTGEIAKVVKYVHHFDGERNEDGTWKSIDSIVLEVHDMAIGLENTKVLEFVYTRAE